MKKLVLILLAFLLSSTVSAQFDNIRKKTTEKIDIRKANTAPETNDLQRIVLSDRKFQGD